MAGFSHVTVGTNDIDRARGFYDAVLAPFGWSRLKDFDTASLWGDSRPRLFAMKPANGEAACVGNGVTICLEADDRPAVAAFHAAALALGAPDEGAVGPRGWWPNAFAAYTRDPDGNKLAAFCFAEA